MQPFLNCVFSSFKDLKASIQIVYQQLLQIHEIVDSELGIEAANHYYSSSAAAGSVNMEKKAIVEVVLLVVLLGFATPAVSLIVNTTLTDCSSTCESKNCADPLNLRYGKYCGLGYTGCSGQSPCDGIDSCCQTHDNCVGSNLANYVNRTCNDGLKTCLEQFKNSSLPQFTGSNCSATEVENVLITSMDVATLGKSAGRPQINLHWIEALVSILSALLIFGW